MKIDSPTFLSETTFISASVQFSSGSQKFGNTADDIHQFTGSLAISGDMGENISGSSTSTGSFGDGRFAGNVGIGVTDPDSKLEVQGSDLLANFGGTNAGFYIRNNTANYISFQGYGSDGFIFKDGGNERIRIEAAGNMGIGNTNPDEFESSANDLVVGSTSGDNGITIVTGTTSKGKIHFADGTSGDASYRGFIFYDHNSDGGMGFGTSATERVKIDGSGNVGIGTSSPGTNLHIYKSSTDVGLRLTAVATSDARLADISFFNDTDSVGAIQAYRDGADDQMSMRFLTQGSDGNLERLRITHDAKISGSSTSTGSFGTVVIPNQENLQFGDLNTRIRGDNSNNNLTFHTNNTERVRIDDNGMGIGGDPVASNGLTIHAVNPGLTLRSSNTTGACKIRFADTGDADIGLIEYGHSSNAMVFSTGDAEAFRLDTNQNAILGGNISGSSTSTGSFGAGFIDNKLGIGTTSPLAPLDVDGNVYVRGGNTFYTDNIDHYTGGSTALTIGSANEIAIKGNNVGIGATNPATLLEVSGSEPTIRISDTASSGKYFNMFLASGGGTSKLRFNSEAASNTLVIGNNNRVSIANASLDEAFNVTGNAKVSGDIIIAAGSKLKEPDGNGYISFSSAYHMTGSSAGDIVFDIDNNGNETNSFLRITKDNQATQLFKIDESGHVGIGAEHVSGHILHINAGDTIVSLTETGGNSGAYLDLGRAKGSVGSPSDLDEADLQLGMIRFMGREANGDRMFANIQAFTGGVPTGASYPSYLTFSTTATSSTTPSERMRIDKDGNVGIGTTSPESLLHIEGTTNATMRIHNTTSGNAPQLLFEGKVGTNVDYLLGKIDATWDGASNVVSSVRFESGADTSNKDDGMITFWTSPASSTIAERMRIDQSGNVGIGTVSPDSNLHIFSTSANKPKINLESQNAGSQGPALDFFVSSSSPAVADELGDLNFVGMDSTGVKTFYSMIRGLINNPANGSETGGIQFSTRVNGSSAARMIISGSNVGIGTTSPDTNLHIHKASAGSIDSHASAVLTLEDDGTNILQFLSPSDQTAQVRFGDTSDDGAGFVSYNHSTNKMSFGTAGPTKMAIDTNGYIIIDGQTDNIIHTGTSDASDNKSIRLDAGGGGGSSTRGAFVAVHGNEHGSDPGELVLQSGNVTGAAITFRGSGGVDMMEMTKEGTLNIGQSSGTGNVSGSATSTGSFGHGHFANNLGIGNTNPDALLEVGPDANSRSIVKLTSTNAAKGAFIQFFGNDAESAVIGYEGGSEVIGSGVQGDFVIRNVLSGKDIILGTNAGYVGINTVTPAYTLDVLNSSGHSEIRARATDGSNRARLRLDANAQIAEIYFANNGTNKTAIYANGGGDESLNFWSFAGGIGTTATMKEDTGDWNFHYNVSGSASSTGSFGSLVVAGDSSISGKYILDEQGRQDHVANTMSSPYYRLDGSNDYISIADNANLEPGTGDFSYEMLVRADDWTGQWFFSKFEDGNNDFRFGTNLGDKLQFYSVTGGIAEVDLVATKTGSLVDGEWAHVAVVAPRAGSGSLYVNGSQIPTQQNLMNADDISNTGDLHLGRRDSAYYASEMASFRFFNKALTDAEVKELSSGGSTRFRYKGASQTSLVTGDDSTFASNTGFWTLLAGSGTGISIASGTLQFNAIQSGYGAKRQNLVTSGKAYRATFTISSYAAGAVKVYGNGVYSDDSASSNGTHSLEFVAGTANTDFWINGIGTTTLNIDNFTLVQIGAVVELDGASATGTKWLDKSGNDLDGTVNGALLENKVDSLEITGNISGSSISTGSFGNIQLGDVTGNAHGTNFYEEGEYTPTITPQGSGTITVGSSYDKLRFTRMGRVVHITGNIIVGSVSSPAGTYVSISLPFTAANDGGDTSDRALGQYGYYDNSESAWAMFPLFVDENQSGMVVHYNAVTGGGLTMPNVNTIAANDQFRIDLTYTI